MRFITGTLGAGAELGFWVWLGFVATTSAGDYLFTGRPAQLYMINNGFQLVALLIMGAVMAVWR